MVVVSHSHSCAVAISSHAPPFRVCRFRFPLPLFSVASVHGCSIFFFLHPLPASYSAGHLCLLARNVRTHPGRAPLATPAATPGLLRPLFPFRPPKVYIQFRGSLLPTRQRNHGISPCRLRLSLSRDPLLFIRTRAPTVTWRGQGPPTYGLPATQWWGMKAESPTSGVTRVHAPNRRGGTSTPRAVTREYP